MTSQRPPDARITGGFTGILKNSGREAKGLRKLAACRRWRGGFAHAALQLPAVSRFPAVI
jgi:hypothetical protein